jgi:hypothetical protein
MAKATVRGGWSSPTKLVLGKTEVTIDGEARSVQSSLNAWATAHASTQRRPEKDDVEVGVGAIDVPDGHVVWTRPSAQGVTRAEAGSVRGSITWTGSAVEAHLLSEALTLETRVGPFGPWSVNVDRSPKELRVHFGFDPAVLDGPSALWVDTVGGDTSFEIKIPRSSTGALGVPQGVFGDDFPLPQQIELSLRYSTMGHDQATAQLKAAAYGARLAGLGTSLDAQLTADAAGPAGSAMAIKNGAFVLGPVRGAVSGSITPADGGVRANLAWRGDPISCASLVGLPSATAATRDLERKARKGDMGDLGDLARDFGSIGQAVGAIKVTGTFIATGTVTLDTSALTDTKWTVASKNSCGISLFQGK